MSYTPFYINPQLTDLGYQKLFVQGGQVSIAEIALGAANGASGYATAFRDTRTELMDEKQRKQVGASQAEDAIDDDGNPFRRIDYATMFTGNANYDAWEIGFFDTDGDLIYVWSATTGLAFVPVRINLDIAVLFAQYLTMQEEITNVTVVDSGYPFELFVGALTDSAAAMLNAHVTHPNPHANYLTNDAFQASLIELSEEVFNAINKSRPAYTNYLANL